MDELDSESEPNSPVNTQEASEVNDEPEVNNVITVSSQETETNDVIITNEESHQNEVISISSQESIEPITATRTRKLSREKIMTIKDFNLNLQQKIMMTIMKMRLSFGVEDFSLEFVHDVYSQTFGGDLTELMQAITTRQKSKRSNEYFKLDDNETFTLFPNIGAEHKSSKVDRCGRLYQELEKKSHAQKRAESMTLTQDWLNRWASLVRKRNHSRSSPVPASKLPKIDDQSQNGAKEEKHLAVNGIQFMHQGKLC